MKPIDKSSIEEGLSVNLDESVEAEKRLDAFKKGKVGSIQFEKMFDTEN